MKNFYFGLLAEYIAILLYRLKFYTIIAHRRKTYAGELDIIATRRRLLVFIEVKARKRGITYLNLSAQQTRRLSRAAALFIGQNARYRDYDIRFDLVLISPYRWPQIIKNAW